MKRQLAHFLLRNAWAVTVVAAVAGMLAPAELNAKVAEIELKDLATGSDLIVVARVSKVEDGPAHLERKNRQMPALRVATAQVMETWKGAPVREVRFVASPSWVCDTSSAEKGERIVLFLRRRNDSAIMSIAHAGRGRMPIREVGAKLYAVLQDDVILPKGTPTISEQKTARWSFPTSESGKPGPALTFTYSIASIEIGVLRGLVSLSGH